MSLVWPPGQFTQRHYQVSQNDVGEGGLIPNDAVVLLPNKKKIYPEINEVLNNIGDYQEMVNHGRKRVIETFSDVNVCQAWLDMFGGDYSRAIKVKG